MKRTQVRSGTHPLGMLLIAALALAALPAVAAADWQPEAAGFEIATATVYAGGVDLQPAATHRGGFITVSGGGVMFRQQVGAGESPSLGVFDPEGQLLPDGIYKWELQLVPNAATAKRLRTAAAENGGRAPGAWRPLSGTFAIRNGLIQVPDLVEAAPERESEGSSLPLELGSSSGPREAALDDDASVASHAAVAAAGAAPPQGAVAGPAGADRTVIGRSDAGAPLVGASLEGALSPNLLPAERAASERPVRNYIIDKKANGRDRSEQR